MTEKILISGVGGFIGSRVAKRFIDEGHQVFGVDDLSSGSLENIPKGLNFIRGDLALTETMVKIPAGCKKILHLAGQSSGEISFDDPIADLNKNTISTLNLIKYGIENNAERIVYASSMSVYGNVPDQAISETAICQPISCYGASKMSSEAYLQIYQNRLPYVILRMFNVYGPGQDMQNFRQGMVSIYVAQALNSGVIQVKGSLERFRDYVYIDDVVDCWYKAAINGRVLKKVYNLGTGKKTTVVSLIELIRNIIPDTSYYQSNSTPGDQIGIYADPSELMAAIEITSFTPLEIGLQKFINWARELC